MTSKIRRNYLSTSGGKWRVISNGAPICKDVETASEAIAAANCFRIPLSDHAWNGDMGEWVEVDTIAKATGEQR